MPMVGAPEGASNRSKGAGQLMIAILLIALAAGAASALMFASIISGALISLLRGRQFYYDDAGAAAAAAPIPPARTVPSIPNANSSAGSPARRTDPARAEGSA